MPINAEAVCVPPTVGISCCQRDINKAGCALSSALQPLVFPVDCLLWPLHALPEKRLLMCHCCLEASVQNHIFQSCNAWCQFFFCCDALTSSENSRSIVLRSLNWSHSQIWSRRLQFSSSSYCTEQHVTLEKQTPPPQSQPGGAQSLFLFFSLCQTAYGEINWWVHGNRVAIETSHMRLEFVTRGKNRRRGGCVECSLGGYQSWSHLQHNINAMFYFFSSITAKPHWKHHGLLQASLGYLWGRFSLCSCTVCHKH